MYDALVFNISNHSYPEGGSKDSDNKKSDQTKGRQLHRNRPRVILHWQQTKAACESGKRGRGVQSSKPVMMSLCEGVTSGVTKPVKKSPKGTTGQE